MISLAPDARQFLALGGKECDVSKDEFDEIVRLKSDPDALRTWLFEAATELVEPHNHSGDNALGRAILALLML